MLLLFLSSSWISQDPPKKVKAMAEIPSISPDTIVMDSIVMDSVEVEPVDNIYLEQRAVANKLDSLLKRRLEKH